ncbi:MAG TPA: hypothetical protein VGP64_03475 [Polyangia bacterium]
MFEFALLLSVLDVSCSSFGSPQCCAPQPDAGVCGTSFTACVHTCGETDTSEATAATCGEGSTGASYSCAAPLVPAVSCPASGWSTALPCGPWPNGYDCGSGCAACVQGLWDCAPCGDSGTVSVSAH